VTHAIVPQIDAHQHFWHFDAARDAWITPDMGAIRRDFLPADLEPVLRESGIDGCIAVEAHPSLEQTRFLLDLAGRHSFIRGVVGWVDLVAPDLDRALDEVADEPKLVGFRHPAQAESDDWLARDDVARGIGRLTSRHLAFDVLILEHQLPSALALAARVPEQTLVVDHLAKPRIRDHAREPWATNIRALAAFPNVVCKISGLVTEADWNGWRLPDLVPYLDIAFEAFGPQRVLFGSDWPVCLVAARYDEVLGAVQAYTAGLSRSEQDAFFGGNAQRVYGLGS
jgi:L-fucono-1,5-lactonase